VATIGKTFSDPTKWAEPWFISLTLPHKLLYTYLWEMCDHAGVIHIVPALWQAHTGLQVDQEMISEFVETVNEDAERIAIIGRSLWFTEYIRFNQQSDLSEPLKPNYSFHKHVFKLIRKHSLIDEIIKRDKVLLQEFLKIEDDQGNGVSVGETMPAKPSLSLTQALVKPTGKGAGKGTGKGTGREQGKGTPLDTTDDLVIDRVLNPKPALQDPLDFEREQMRKREARMNQQIEDNGLPF